MMATQQNTKARNLRDATRAPRHPASRRFETSPERIEAIRDTIRAIMAVDFDVLSQTEEVRAVAKRLRVPYVFASLVVDENLSTPTLTEDDLTEYYDWKSAS